MSDDDNALNLKYQEEIARLQTRVNELTALCYQVTNHFENEFFNNQSIVRTIRDKLVMTPEVWAIVDKSKQPQQEPSNNQ